MTTDNVATYLPAAHAQQQKPLTVRIAERFGVEPGRMLETLKQTAFKSDRPISNEQMMALLVVAEQYHLNPFTRELFAFPDKGGIVPVVSVDGWARIINEHPQFDGIEFEHGVHAQDGPFCTCTIHRKDRGHPIAITEYLQECERSTAPWKSHPRRMLRHKALIQCARLGFGFAGIYDEDEAQRIVHGGMVERVEPPSAGASRVRAILNNAEGQPEQPQQVMRADASASGEPAPVEPSAPPAGGPRVAGRGAHSAATAPQTAPPASEDVEVFEPRVRSLAAYMDEVLHADDAESAGVVLDEARGLLIQPEHSQLVAAYRSKWTQPE